MEPESLPNEAQQELKKLDEWIKDTQFEQVKDEPYLYFTKAEAEALVERCGKVLAHFSKGSTGQEARVTAIRFHKPATVPVQERSTVDLIPIRSASGTPTIGGQKVEIGQYMHLTEATQVEPDFFCLLLLRQNVE